VEGRKHVNIAEISNAEGEVLARSTGTFIAIDPEKMFPQLMKGASAASTPNSAETR
jgi:hypothetical protein